MAWSLGPVLALIFLPLASTLPTPDHQPQLYQASRFVGIDEPTFVSFLLECSKSNAGGPSASGLTINVAVAKSARACEGQNVTINGQALLQPTHLLSTWSGEGRFHFQASIGKTVHNITASWKSQCTMEKAVFDSESMSPSIATHTLKMQVTEIDSLSLAESSDLTAIIDRSPIIENLDLGPDATTHLVDKLQIHASAPLLDEDASEPAAIQSFREELRKMKQDSEALEYSINELRKVLTVYDYKHSESLSKKVQKCHSAKCATQAIAYNTHSALNLMLYKIKALHEQQHLGQRPSTLWREAGSKYDRNQAIAELGDRAFADHIKHDFILKSLLAFEILLLLLFLHRRYCNSVFRSERQWDYESRRNMAAIRRAHRYRRVQSWFHQLFKSRQLIQIEEKQARIVSQEVILESAVQAEIRQLRLAADFVSAITCSSPSSSDSSSLPHRLASALSTQSSSPSIASRQPADRPESLPDYGSDGGYSDGPPPPGYEDNADDNSELFGAVADGFQFRNRRSDSIHTPESSVISTSPRWSAEVEYTLPPNFSEL